MKRLEQLARHRKITPQQGHQQLLVVCGCGHRDEGNEGYRRHRVKDVRVDGQSVPECKLRRVAA